MPGTVQQEALFLDQVAEEEQLAIVTRDASRSSYLSSLQSLRDMPEPLRQLGSGLIWFADAAGPDKPTHEAGCNQHKPIASTVSGRR
jgi:hypothetical protein